MQSLIQILLPKTLRAATFTFVVFASFLLPTQGHAATATWTGPSSGLWTTAANWSGPIPSGGDDAIFPSLGGFRTVNLNGSQSANSVQFNSVTPNSYLLFSGSLAINNFVDQAGSADGSFNAPVAFGPSITLSGAGSGNVFFNGGLSGSPFISMVGGNYWWSGVFGFNPAALTVSGGYLHLIGTNQVNFSGNVQIQSGGMMCVQGFFPSTVSAPAWYVLAGGTLKVSGPITGPVFVTGGTFMAGCSPGTANILNDLSIDSSSHAQFELATPNIVANGNDYVSVSGTLTLGGMLDISALPNFGAGTYRLFDASSIINNGVVLGQVPNGYVCQLDFSTPNQVNLQVANAPILSYGVTIPAGLSLIANQLDHGSNTLNVVLSNAPDGSALYKYNNSNSIWTASTYSAAAGAWLNGDIITLSPGEGAFLQSPSNFTLTFTGTPHVPVLPLTIPAGAVYLLSRQTNDVGTYENIVGNTPPDGAIVYKWNGSGYVVYFADSTSPTGWTDSSGSNPVAEPTAAVGESLWISPSGTGTPGSPPVPVVYTGLSHAPVGAATLATQGNVLTVANIGSSGQDGVSIALPPDAAGLEAHWQDLDPSNILPVGAYVKEQVFGSGPGVNNGLLGTVTIAKAGDTNYPITADFSPVGSTSNTVQVYLQGALVAQLGGQSGAIGSASSMSFSGDFSVTCCPKTYTVSVDWGSSPATLTLNGGLTVLGDEMVITPEGVSSATQPTAFQITASQISSITITNETVERSYPVNVPAGYSMLANQLDHGSNTLDEVLSTVPDGSALYKYSNNSSNGGWIVSTFSAAAGRWLNGDAITLNPGEGAFLQSPSNFTITFTGHPHVPVLPVTIPAGQIEILSRQTNDVGTYDNIIGSPPQDGATIYQWKPGSGTYSVSSYFGGYGWFNNDFPDGGPIDGPTANIGESLWISASGGGSIPVLPFAAGITILSPTNGNTLCAGSTTTINWSGGNPSWNVLISLIDIPSWTVYYTIAPSVPNSGSYVWNIPPTLPPSTYAIYIQEVSVTTWAYGANFTVHSCPTNPCVPAPAGLGLWLPLDESSGVTSANLVAGGNNGTHINSPSVIGGYVANSLAFNGMNQFVTVPSYAAINPGAGQDFSIDAWVNRSSASGNGVRVIVDKRDANTGLGYSLAISFGNLIFQMNNGSGFTNFRDTGTVPADDKWHFVGVTISRGLTNGGRFFIDAGPTSTFDPTPYPGSLANSAAFQVGASGVAGNSPWLGDLDEIEFFQRALSISEMQTIFLAGSAGKCKCLPPPANMGLWLPLDETTGVSSVNLAAGGLNGTRINNPTVIGGYVANSLSFNGVNQFVTVPDYPAIDPGAGQNFSIDAWVKRAANNPNSPPSIIVDKRNPGNGLGYSLALSYGNLIFQMNNGSTFANYRDTGFIPPDNKWHFIAVTITRSLTNGGRFYLDGNPTGTFNPTAFPGNLGSTAPFRVASSPIGGNVPWLGAIDEVEYFQRALTAQEVRSIFSVGTTGKCKQGCGSPLVLSCATNQVVECGTAFSFTPPTATEAGCSNISIQIVGTVTNANSAHPCWQDLTRTWSATDCCSNSATCSQTITISHTTPPTISCTASKTVECGTQWKFDAPAAFDCNGTTLQTIILSTVTNGSACSQVITRTWIVTDSCGYTNSCSQTITTQDTTPPVLSCAHDKTIECNSPLIFDPPTATDACCGSNVTITVVSTFTNNPAACSTSITRTWSARDCCGNSNVCSQMVTISDTVPPVFATSCVTNDTLVGGNNFASPIAASPSPGLLARLHAAGITQFKNFDQCTVNTYFAHSFTNLPHCLTSAILKVRMKPCGDLCYNDAINISFTSPGGVLQSNSWVRYLGAGNPQTGLDSDDWCGHGAGQVFIFDLSALPQPSGPPLNLLAQLNALGYVDFTSQDDSGVDYLELTTISCCYQPTKTVECGSRWQFDLPSATDACCGTNVTISVFSTVTNGVCPKTATRTWQATDCCGNNSYFSQVVTMVDNSPPVVYCPGPITRYTCNSSERVYYYVYAIDACSGSRPVTCTPASGSLFPVGTTTVSCTATDACGHVGSCSFTVSVVQQILTGSILLGLPDCYKQPTEAAPKSGALLAAHPGSCWKAFDATQPNCAFGASFMGLPNTLTCAQLIITMLPNCGDIPDNDSISIGLSTNGVGGFSNSWSSYIGGGNPGPSLTPSVWCGQSGCGQQFTLNLASMPAPGGNLLPLMNAQGKLDIYVQDDTYVDFARLNYCYCRVLPWWYGWEWNLANAGISYGQNFASFSPLWSLGYQTNHFTVTLAPGATHGIQLGLVPLNLGSIPGSSLIVSAQTTVDPDSDAIQLTGDGNGRISFLTNRRRAKTSEATVTLRLGGFPLAQTNRPANPGTLLLSMVGTGSLVQIQSTHEGEVYSFALDAAAAVPEFGGILADGVDVAFFDTEVDEALTASLSIDVAGLPELQLTSAAAEVTGLFPQVTGNAHAIAGGDQVSLDNIGSSGQDGVFVRQAPTNLLALDLNVAQNLNGTLETNGLVAGTFSGVVAADEVDVSHFSFAQSSLGWDLSGDFSGLSASSMLVQIFNQGTLVASLTFTGTPHVPVLPARYGLQVSSQGTWSSFTWQNTQSITINGTGYQGDEIRLVPVAPDLSLNSITSAQIQVSGIDGLTLSSVGQPPPVWVLLTPIVTPVSMTIQWIGPVGGMLESAPTVLGPWTVVPNQSNNTAVVGSPLTNGIPMRFFRVQQN